MSTLIMTTDRCWECRRMILELENLGVKFAKCGTCKDTIIRPDPTIRQLDTKYVKK